MVLKTIPHNALICPCLNVQFTPSVDTIIESQSSDNATNISLHINDATFLTPASTQAILSKFGILKPNGYNPNIIDVVPGTQMPYCLSRVDGISIQQQSLVSCESVVLSSMVSSQSSTTQISSTLHYQQYPKWIESMVSSQYNDDTRSTLFFHLHCHNCNTSLAYIHAESSCVILSPILLYYGYNDIKKVINTAIETSKVSSIYNIIVSSQTANPFISLYNDNVSSSSVHTMVQKHPDLAALLSNKLDPSLEMLYSNISNAIHSDFKNLIHAVSPQQQQQQLQQQQTSPQSVFPPNNQQSREVVPSSSSSLAFPDPFLSNITQYHASLYDTTTSKLSTSIRYYICQFNILLSISLLESKTLSQRYNNMIISGYKPINKVIAASIYTDDIYSHMMTSSSSSNMVTGGGTGSGNQSIKSSILSIDPSLPLNNISTTSGAAPAAIVSPTPLVHHSSLGQISNDSLTINSSSPTALPPPRIGTVLSPSLEMRTNTAINTITSSTTGAGLPHGPSSDQPTTSALHQRPNSTRYIHITPDGTTHPVLSECLIGTYITLNTEGIPIQSATTLFNTVSSSSTTTTPTMATASSSSLHHHSSSRSSSSSSITVGLPHRYGSYHGIDRHDTNTTTTTTPQSKPLLGPGDDDDYDPSHIVVQPLFHDTTTNNTNTNNHTTNNNTHINTNTSLSSDYAALPLGSQTAALPMLPTAPISRSSVATRNKKNHKTRHQQHNNDDDDDIEDDVGIFGTFFEPDDLISDNTHNKNRRNTSSSPDTFNRVIQNTDHLRSFRRHNNNNNNNNNTTNNTTGNKLSSLHEIHYYDQPSDSDSASLATPRTNRISSSWGHSSHIQHPYSNILNRTSSYSDDDADNNNITTIQGYNDDDNDSDNDDDSNHRHNHNDDEHESITESDIHAAHVLLRNTEQNRAVVYNNNGSTTGNGGNNTAAPTAMGTLTLESSSTTQTNTIHSSGLDSSADASIHVRFADGGGVGRQQSSLTRDGSLSSLGTGSTRTPSLTDHHAMTAHSDNHELMNHPQSLAIPIMDMSLLKRHTGQPGSLTTTSTTARLNTTNNTSSSGTQDDRIIRPSRPRTSQDEVPPPSLGNTNRFFMSSNTNNNNTTTVSVDNNDHPYTSFDINRQHQPGHTNNKDADDGSSIASFEHDEHDSVDSEDANIPAILATTLLGATGVADTKNATSQSDISSQANPSTSPTTQPAVAPTATAAGAATDKNTALRELAENYIRTQGLPSHIVGSVHDLDYISQQLQMMALMKQGPPPTKTTSASPTAGQGGQSKLSSPNTTTSSHTDTTNKQPQQQQQQQPIIDVGGYTDIVAQSLIDSSYLKQFNNNNNNISNNDYDQSSRFMNPPHQPLQQQQLAPPPPQPPMVVGSLALALQSHGLVPKTK